MGDLTAAQQEATSVVTVEKRTTCPRHRSVRKGKAQGPPEAEAEAEGTQEAEEPGEEPEAEEDSPRRSL